MPCSTPCWTTRTWACSWREKPRSRWTVHFLSSLRRLTELTQTVHLNPSFCFLFSSRWRRRATACPWTTAGWAAARTRARSPPTARGRWERWERWERWACRNRPTSSCSTTRTRTTAARTGATTCPTSSSQVRFGSRLGLGWFGLGWFSLV